MVIVLLQVAVAAGLVALLVGAWFFGKMLGHRMSSKLSQHPQFGIVQAATMSMLGLLLGFCFLGSISRFVERQDILVREANSVGTLYDVADLLPDAPRDRTKELLREYMAQRLELFAQAGIASEQVILDRLYATTDRTWVAVREGVMERPQYAAVVVPAYTAVPDTLALRNASELRHLPPFVLAVLITCAFAGIASVGMGVEKSNTILRRPSLILVLLVAATLWTTIDLDYPRAGLIRLNPQPLRDAAAKVTAPAQR
ncbi:MAG: hypothetical protein ACKVS8_03900 [Phycisphaerales bacterium]